MMRSNSSELAKSLKSAASERGFELCGIAPAVSPSGVQRLENWLDHGFHGEMEYMPARREAYRHPDAVLAGVKSVVMLGMDYSSVEPTPPPPGHGRIARYAWGAGDYHDVMKQRLRELETFLLNAHPSAAVRSVVDTAPLLEREFAQLAGLGWFGKNTMLLNKHRGSYFFLAALLTDIELPADEPFESDHCGRCTACLDACPTDAFPEAGVLDATKCISYLTIEHRSSIPPSLRSDIGTWLFGCDICQEVCPWNRHARPTAESTFQPLDENNPIELTELFYWPEEAWRKRFRDTPLWRAKRRGLLRNAAIVLGNHPSERAVPALCCGLRDRESLVRDAAAWALGCIGGAEAVEALSAQIDEESDEDCRRAIQEALGRV